MSRGFGYVIAKCLSAMLGAAVLAALLSGLVGWAAWEWVVPAHGLSAARAFVRMASVAIGLGSSTVAMVMLVRHLYGRSRRNRSDRGGINASVLDAVVPRMRRSGRQALCCLLAFLLTFSLLGDGVAAYADELRGDTGAPQAESDIQTPGADGEQSGLPGPADEPDEETSPSPTEEDAPSSAESDLGSDDVLPLPSEEQPEDPSASADAGSEGEGLHSEEATEEVPVVEVIEPAPPVDYYAEPEPEGELISAEDGVAVYQLSETRFRTVLGGVATAYVDEDGSARPIDNTLVVAEEPANEGPVAAFLSLFAPDSPERGSAAAVAEGASDSGEGDGAAPVFPEPNFATVYEPAANGFDLRLPAALGEGRGIVIEKDGHRIELVPEEGDFTHSAAEGNAIRYTEVRPGVDYQYTLLGGVVKEDVILTRPVEAFAPAMKIIVDDDLEVVHERGIVIVREKGAAPDPSDGESADPALAATAQDPREIITLSAPIAIDAAEAVDNSVSMALGTAEDGTPVARVEANWEWLSAPERAYPVRIDPTIDIAKSAMRVTAVEQLAPDTYVGENDFQYAGYDDGDKTGTAEFRGGYGLGMCRVYLAIQYDFGNIMDEARIDSAKLWLHQRTAFSNGKTELGLYRNKSSWDFDSITWNSQKSMGHEFVTSQNARTSKGYLAWDVREPVNNWVQGTWGQNGLCIKATDERNMQCELLDNKNADNPPSLEIDWAVPDPVSESLSLNATTINLRTVTEADFAGKLQLDGVFADGVAQPRSMVAYELVGKNDAGVAYASRSYKYPDSTEWEKQVPSGTKYRDKLSNWQSKLFGGFAFNTSYKVRARAAANGSSGKLVESDSFLVYKATAKDTLPSIASHYGVSLNTLAQDNRVQDTLIVGGNTIFVRNPKTTKAYNPKQLTDSQKKRIDSALMGRGRHCEYGFEPINLNTGNFILEATDASVPGLGGDFALTRTYNAQGDGYLSSFGRNWSFAWDESLGLQENGAAVYSVGDGKTYWFDPDGKGGFKRHGEAGLALKKIAYKEGSATRYRWEIVDDDGTVRRFDKWGRLTEIQDAGGSITRIGRDANGHIASLADRTGTSYAVTCNAQGLITAVSLPGGARLAYGYDAGGNLTSFTDAGGRAVRYEYDGAGRMTAWYDQNGRRVVANTYDGANRVTRQVDLAGNVNTLSYGSGYTRATDAAGRTTVHRYDDRGRTTSIEYPDGRKVARVYGANNTLISDENGTYAYDAAGNLVQSTSPDGHVTRYTYDGKNHVTSRTDPDGATTRYTYDGAGNLLSETSPATGTTAYTYDFANRCTSKTDADGVRETYAWTGAKLMRVETAAGTTRYAYDAMGRKVSETDPAGHGRTWAYDAAGHLVGERDGAGGSRSYRLDGLGLVKAITDERGYTTSFTYDGAYRIATMTDPAGGVTRYGYDKAGNLVRQVEPGGAVATYAYDARDRMVSETDALGHTTRYAYDERDNVIRVESPDGVVEEAAYDDTYGVPTSYTDPLGNVTTYRYDAAGHLTETEDALGVSERITWEPGGRRASVADGRGTTTSYAYTAAGRVSSIDEAGRTWSFAYDGSGAMEGATDPAGRAFSFTWDGAGNLTSLSDGQGAIASWTHDGEGRTLSETDALGAVTRFAYDGAGNVVRECDALGHETSYEYDAFGAVTAVTDAAGNTVRCEYDEAGNVVAVTDALGHRRTAAYDAVGNLVSATDTLGNVTAYEHDTAGRVTARVRPDGARETSEYDKLGRLVRTVDAAGVEATYEWDVRDNLTAVSDSAGSAEVYEYDGAGNLTSATDSLGRTASLEYDAWGREVRASDFDGSVTTYEYDAAGNLSREIDGLGHAISYGWDARNNLLSETREADGAVTSYEYDAAGNITAATDAMGAVRRWAYDAVGNTTEAVDEEGNATTYGYDALGNLVRSTDPLGNSAVFVWDANGNLTAATSPEGSRDQWAYDGEGRLMSHTDALGREEQWAWDALGNLTTHTDTAGAATSYRHDAVGNLTAETDPLGRTTAYEYDARGNVLSRTAPGGGRWEYGWDELDRLTRITTPRGYVRELEYDEAGNAAVDRDNLGARVTYSYDLLGRLTGQEDAAGHKRSWEWDDAGNLAAETDAAGVRTEYAYDGLDRLVSQRNGEGESARWAWDARGNLVAQGGTDIEGLVFSYDAAGNLTSQADARGNITAYEWDGDGRLARQTSPMGAVTTYRWDKVGNLSAVTDSLGRVSSWDYDDANRVVRATDRNGHSAAYEWDDAGQLTKVTSPEGAVTSYEYDLDGNLAQVTDAMGRITRYGYDAEGGLTSVESPSGALEEFVRDPAGRVTAVVDAAGNATTYDWDELGNLVEKGYSQGDAQSVLYAYDANGLVTARADAMGEAAYEYDEVGRVIAEADGQGRRIQYTYNSLGELDSVTYPDGSVVAYAYDAVGNLIQVRTAEGDYTYEYDEENRPVRLMRPDGSVTTYEYDGEGQLAKLENAGADGDSVSSFAYKWDGEGNPIAEEAVLTNPDGVVIQSARIYAYDDDDRLIAFEEKTDDGSGETHIREEYQWDAAGNRTAIERTDVVSGSTALTKLIYDDDDRLVESVGPEGRTTYEYDKAGNLVRKDAAGEDPVEYAYTAENRLAAVRQGGRVLMAATYDGDGNRVFQATLYHTDELAVGTMPFTELEPKEVTPGQPLPEPEDPAWWGAPTRVAPRWTAAEFGRLATTGTWERRPIEAPVASWRAASAKREAPGSDPALRWAVYGAAVGAASALVPACPAATALVALLDGLLDPLATHGAQPFGIPLPGTDAALLAAATLSSEERQTILSSAGVPLAAPRALPLRGNDLVPAAQEPAVLKPLGDSVQVRYGTIPTYTPYVQERWELVAYVNSTVIDDVAQPLARESSVSGALNDTYGLGRLSTVGGTEAVPVADTYLEDGFGSVSAVMAGDGRIAASYAYAPWGEAAADTGEFGGPALGGIGYQSELPHYGYNGEEATGAAGLQYLRARWYDPGAGTFGSRDTYLGDAADPATLNRYAYAEGNPVASADPTGHESRSTRGKTAKQVRKNSYSRNRVLSGGKGTWMQRSYTSKALKTKTSGLLTTNRSMDRRLASGGKPKAPFQSNTIIRTSGSSVIEKAWSVSQAARSVGRTTKKIFSPSKKRKSSAQIYAEREAARIKRLMCSTLPYYNAPKQKNHNSDTHTTLDIIGTFDPTPLSDGVNAIAYWREKDYTNMAISAIAAIIPYGGDLLKGGKVAKSIAKAASDASKESAAALKLGRPASSKVLAHNMKEAGVTRPSSDYAAHHIIAGGAAKADEARRVLEKWGIDINDPANGVYLPTKKEIVPDSAYHPGLHTNEYYKEVNTRILKASGSKKEVLEELAKIRGELVAGTFDY